ncbi:MAG: fluoride efflux transporter CrcB [Sphingomonas adhaesiva]|uniref:fluoride efflux transporter CrcB n=1 Tax=Sphingomonas adhaesiva TaxID=28212 RepID=UPI002FF84AA6
MYPLLLVMAGGAVGAGARHLVNRATLSAFGPDWPWGTLTVNLVGGLLMGALVGVLARGTSGGDNWRLLLGTGVLGGFTTFSAFALDTVGMIQRGDLAAATGYVLLSVAGAVLALFLGLSIARVAA